MSIRTAVAAMLMLGTAATASAQSPVERGKYLASIMDCVACHTDGALIGKPDMGRFLGGSTIGHEIPGLGIFYAPNLTPDRDTGLGAWSEAEIIRAVRQGQRPDGRELVPAMPWRSYAALTDSDARALVAYLKSLPPVRNSVPAIVAPGETPKAPFLRIIQP